MGDKKPSPRILSQFIDKGGYEILESMGTGSTSEEKQTNGWKEYGIISKLVEVTKISRPTIYKIKDFYPNRKSMGSTLVGIKADEFQRLEDSLSRLKTVEKSLNELKEYFDRSLVIDLLKLKARQELLGETVESQRLTLKEQIEAGEKGRSSMENLLDDVIKEFRDIWLNVRFITSKVKRD